MQQEKLTRDDCLALLRACAEGLAASGEARFPRKTDFTPQEVMGIKARLGPWPRALEAAGIKPASPAREEARLEKRIRQKRARTRIKIEKKEALGNHNNGGNCP